ncbi:MAG: hypothetical protein LUH55_03235 [Bacteroides thetaiotaomicron]|nr:hypothetical protein [Bacteroides thetaiotaomicron]
MRSGDEKYWKAVEHAERIYRAKAESRTSDERSRHAKHGRDLADRLVEENGTDDKEVSSIIERFGLNRD